MNHIKTIEIKNFKSLRHQKIEDCRRVNVFIGYPNVGKSNILESLGLFGVLLLNNQSFKFNEICRVKHFSELFFNRDTRNSVRVVLNNKIEVELKMDESNDLLIKGNELPYSSIKSNSLFATKTSSSDFQFDIVTARTGYTYGFDGVRKYEFNKDVSLDKNKPRALAVPYGNNLWDALQANGGLRKEIVEIFNEYALKVVFETGDQFSLKFHKELEDGGAVSIPYHQIADTLRRLIFYKAAIQTNSNSVLLFEEPEAHMFPPYISKFTTDVIFDEQDNQFFIATHSPFVINDVMEELKDEELSIYVVGYKKEEGETIIRRLTEEELHEIYQYGIDIYYNLENYLMHEQQ